MLGGELPLGLGERHLRLVPFLAAGLKNAEIAERLSLSQKTVEGYVSELRSASGADSRGKLTVWCIELNPRRAPRNCVGPKEPIPSAHLELTCLLLASVGVARHDRPPEPARMGRVADWCGFALTCRSRCREVPSFHGTELSTPGLYSVWASPRFDGRKPHSMHNQSTCAAKSLRVPANSIRTLVLVLAVLSAVAVPMVGSASHPTSTTGDFASAGCTGRGNSHALIGGTYTTETITPYQQCGWYNLNCWWYVEGNAYAGCPGWQSFPITVGSPYGAANGVQGRHSVCDAGGPCGSAVYKYTLYIH
jgi:hypothetical protein